ncbi:hypothetical protein FKM82_017061 [Ascaphus truei]
MLLEIRARAGSRRNQVMKYSMKSSRHSRDSASVIQTGDQKLSLAAGTCNLRKATGGSLGFWAVLGERFQAGRRRCWDKKVHILHQISYGEVFKKQNTFLTRASWKRGGGI